jgi:hypothetical protein
MWAVILTALSVAPAFAQGTTTAAITGTVADAGGGVIPGANVNVAGEAGVNTNVVTNSEGQFTVPALTPGTYKVTVTLQGFKTAIVENVRVVAGNPTNVSVKMEIGRLEENVTVRSSSELVNTQTATVSSTLNADQLNRMPTTSRNALNAVTFLPGINTPGVNRNSTINGLPQSMINITLDGVSNQDNFNKTGDGFFASVYPRQDAVEAVTVTTAVAGANQGGSGAVTINFTTRSGTNRTSGSAYEYFRHPSLNTNNWANKTVNNTGGLPKNETKLNQYGARNGGPIKLPGLYDGSGKAFYFFHYEELRFPNNFTKTRSAMRPETFDGTFRYTVGTEVRSVNLMQIAAANQALCLAGGGIGPDPCKAAFDPDTVGILNKINAAMQTTGVISNTASPMTVSYSYQSPAELLERQPTVKLDYNLSTQHRLSGSFSNLWATRNPDYLNDTEERFPGAPNFTKFRSVRPLYAFSLRSTLSSSMVNELKVGLTSVHGNSAFGQESDPSSNASSFADIGGYAVSLPFTTNWHTDRTPNWRAAPTYTIDNSMNWQMGRHSLNIGGGYLKSSSWENQTTVVPQVSLGMSTSTCLVPGSTTATRPCDPAFDLFTSTTIPGANATVLGNARAHFAQLTGRITTVSNQVVLDPETNQYVPNIARRREGAVSVWSAYAQDSWRMTPTLTLSAGVRYDLQTPFSSGNDTMSAVTFESVCGQSGFGESTTPYNKCDFFGRRDTGLVPEYVQYTGGTKGYNTDYNNVAPSVSLAWRPNVQSGWLRTILGDPETATLRGGYSVSFERQGLGTLTGIYGGNPGSTLTVTRNSNNGNLVNTGETWPLLYRDRSRLYNGDFPATVSYPIALQPNRASTLHALAPDIEIGHARSWTVGIQRSLSKDMAVDVRYVGTRGVDQWSRLNYNTRDIVTNGFIDEFRLAVANLKANNQSGDASRAGSFKYFGAGTGTNPLPIYMAYLVGASGNPNNPASYSGTAWTSTAITQDMVFVNPNPTNAAADLDGDSTRRANAIAAGRPANFFVVNPAAGAVSVTDSGAFSDYHALQIDLKRRLAQGLSASVNYQWATEAGSLFDGFLYGREMVTSEHIRHAIKTQWDWTLPVGRGQRFLTDSNPVIDGILGGWSFKGVGRFQVRAVDFGNVRLVGMTKDELQDLYRINVKTDPASQVGAQRAYYLPDDIILNTRRAFTVGTSTSNGYGADLGAPEGRYFAPANSPDCIQLRAGDCTPRTLIINAPWFARLDVGVSKRFNLKGSSNIELAFEVLNLMDNINFTPPRAPGTGETIFSTRTIYQDTDNTYDPGGRLGQLMFRINW